MARGEPQQTLRLEWPNEADLIDRNAERLRFLVVEANVFASINFMVQSIFITFVRLLFNIFN